ncbi:MAG: GLPGLI family protein [Petrimonas sp.]|jgi:GLPGLI family protein
MSIIKVKILFALFCSFYTVLCVSAQTEKLKYGGITWNEKDLNELEKAFSGVYYQFNYMIKREGILEKKSDTLFLASGTTQSVFLDPTYKEELENQRKSRITRSKKAKLINPEYEKINDIAELINVNSDYKEDDAGDPVQIYKNRNKGLISSVYNSYTKHIKCEQEVEEMAHWQMVEGTDTILTYPCQKAVVSYAGRDYTAWFAPEIPINDGPWKFWGLPGLILKVTDTQELFEWKAIGLENIDADIVINKGNYDNANPVQFRDFIDRVTGTVMVSFYNNNVLYFTNRERAYSKIPIELFEK